MHGRHTGQTVVRRCRSREQKRPYPYRPRAILSCTAARTLVGSALGTGRTGSAKACQSPISSTARHCWLWRGGSAWTVTMTARAGARALVQRPVPGIQALVRIGKRQVDSISAELLTLRGEMYCLRARSVNRSGSVSRADAELAMTAAVPAGFLGSFSAFDGALSAVVRDGCAVLLACHAMQHCAPCMHFGRLAFWSRACVDFETIDADPTARLVGDADCGQ